MSFVSVRKLVRSVYGKVDEQRNLVRACIEKATQLNKDVAPIAAAPSPSPANTIGTAAAATTTTSTSPSGTTMPPLCSSSSSETTATSSSTPSSDTNELTTRYASPIYTEISNAEDYDRTIPHSSGPLSGITVSVSDSLDVVGFRTRFGMTSKQQVFHREPVEESPFIGWIRQHGAHFVGKLRCDAPLGWDEGTVVSKEVPAYIAVDQRSSHYAITTTVLGAPAVTAPLFHDIVGFKPTSMSFDARQYVDDQHLFASRNCSIGLVAKTLDDIKYLWDVYTGAIQSINVVESIREAEQREEARRLQEGRHSLSASSTSPYHNPNDLFVDALDSLRMEHDAFLDRMVRSTQEPPLALAVGLPLEWIADFFGDRYKDADAFEDKIQALIDDSLKHMNRKKDHSKVEIISLPFRSIDLERVLTAQQQVAEYELYRSMSTSSSLGAMSPNPQWRSRLLDELPQQIAESLARGRDVTEEDYASALRCRDYVVREIDNQFRDVDIICCPILGQPGESRNMRTFLSSLPFAFAGNPMVSLQVDSETPVQLIGEMGRDTGLLEDSTSFMRLMGKGRPPRWWRKKFLGEQ